MMEGGIYTYTHTREKRREEEGKQQTNYIIHHPEQDSRVRCTDVVINNRAGWLNIVHGFLKKGYTPTITNTTTPTYISPTCYIWSTTRLTSKERCAHSAVVGYYMQPSIIPSVSLSNMICLHPLHLYLMWTHTCIISYILRIIELSLKRSDRG